MDPPTNDSQQPCWADPTNNTSSSSNLQTQELHDVQQEEDMDTSTFLTQPYSTLDEPVSETIMRDVRSVAAKIKVVLLPLKKTVRRYYLCILLLFIYYLCV